MVSNRIIPPSEHLYEVRRVAVPEELDAVRRGDEDGAVALLL